MSLGYAEKLSYREDVGTVGMSEIFDPPNVLEEKVKPLALSVAPLFFLMLGLILFIFAAFPLKFELNRPDPHESDRY